MTAVLKPSPKRMTYLEYVEHEMRAEVKSEYHGGEVLEMSGGSIDHSRMIRNLAGELRTLLRNKPCESFESNLKLHSREVDRSVYPDAQVVCGPVEFHGPDINRTTILNPTVVFEVLSPSTASYDRGAKMRLYFSVPSVMQYVLLGYDQPLAELYTRTDGGWLRTESAGLDGSFKLSSIEIELKLAELYLGVEFVDEGINSSPSPARPAPAE
jgi:Uma2 family endonuclease